MSATEMKSWFQHHVGTIGQVSGWSSGVAAYFGLAKDVIGFIGILAGAILSVWALVTKIRQHIDKRRRRHHH